MLDLEREMGKNALGNSKYFDFKMGALGGVVMGAAVYWINSEYGIEASSIAAAKQMGYTFLVGGSVTKMCENLATQFKSGSISRAASVVIPSTITIGLTYLLHSLKGTPEPLNSTVPTRIAAPLGTLWWGNRKRNQLESLIKEMSE